MKEKLINFLKTMPEIKCCTFDFNSITTTIDSINQTPLSISPTLNSILNKKNEYYLSTLMESGLKQNQVIEIYLFLFKWYQENLYRLLTTGQCGEDELGLFNYTAKDYL